MKSETPLGVRRQKLGFSALAFARLLQADFPEMTEGRLFRIETGRSKATETERQVIGRLLGCKPWEIGI